MENNQAVIYIRVSTRDQDEKRQVEELTNYVKFKNLDLKKTFNEKVSGYKVQYKERDEFNELKEYIEDNEISHIVVSELSRIGRRLIETLNFIKDCTEQGVCIHFAKDRIATLNDDGEKNTMVTDMIWNFARMAEKESEMISYRVKSGLHTRYRDGRGFNPRVLGYKRDAEGRAVIDHEQAHIVKEIFEMHQDDISLYKIVNYLNSKYSEVKRFTEGGLRSILRNKIYTGVRSQVNGEFTTNVEPIISQDTYNKSQDLLKNRKRSTLFREHVNPFAGLLFCDICDSILHQVVATEYRTDKYVGSCKDCKLKAINRPHLIQVIKDSLIKQSDNTWLKKDKEKAKKNLSIYKASKSEIKAKLKRISREENELMDYLLDKTISKENYKKRQYKIEQRKNRYLKSLEEVETEITNTQSFIASKLNKVDLNDINEFKKVVQKHLQYVKVTNSLVKFKIKGGFINVAPVYRASELFKYNKGTLKPKFSLEEDIRSFKELLSANDDMDKATLNEMITECNLEHLGEELIDEIVREQGFKILQ